MCFASIILIMTKMQAHSFSYIFILWGIPIIFINVLDLVFLIKSLLLTPKNIDIRFSTIIISLIGATALGSTAFFTEFESLKVPGSQYYKALASLLSLFTYPLIIWALLCLKDCLTIIPEAHKVVASGIYKFSRHPLYVCYSIWAFTYILIFQSIPVIIIISCYLFVLYLRARREEALLLLTFPEYREYYEKTGFIGRKA